MPIDLLKPLKWTSASPEEQAMLDDLQGNILDGHGRRSTRHLFLRFGADAAAARQFVRDLTPMVTSAQKQLREADIFRRTGISGDPFVGFMVSAAGYAALGVEAKAPQSADGGAFSAGMLARAQILSDPDVADLEPAYQSPLHAMILIGADPDAEDSWDSVAAQTVATQIVDMMQGAAQVVATEIGRAIFKDNGPKEGGGQKIEGIEHFGYVDGRSQPLMLEELIERERDEHDGISVWGATFPLGQVLLPDPGSPTPDTAFGSYFVFRKLEQNVRGFKGLEERLGRDPLLGRLGELAGAMLVGRFEDGTPVVMQREEGFHSPVPNNFDYAGDIDGLRCPLHAHIRKTNPRGDTVREFAGATLADERGRIMARRGMTFGVRDRVLDPTDEPTGGVGLMFMAFQSNLADQFEFTQASWANSPDFVRGQFNGHTPVGRDPIIGQRRDGDPDVPLKVRNDWGSRQATDSNVSFGGFVRHLGGDYFFAPARSTLAAL